MMHFDYVKGSARKITAADLLRMYRHAPANIVDVYERPFRDCTAAIMASARVTDGKYKPPQGNPKVTRTAHRPKPVAPTLAISTRRAESIPHHVRSLKVFCGERREQAYPVWMDLRARLGRFNSQPDAIAEKFMSDNGYDVREILATATEGTPQSGGYLVPSPLGDVVIEHRANVGISRKVAFVMPMSSESLSVATVAADSHQTVYYPNEVGAITPSDMTFGQIFMKAKKRAILSYASQELVDDAMISFLDLFVRRAVYGLAKKEDREFILGDGTSDFGLEVGLAGAIGAAGIHSAASGHDLWSELDLGDFTAAMALLPDWAADGRESWIMSSAFYAGVALRVTGFSEGFDDEGHPLFLGRPVHFSADMPTTTGAATIAAFYGNFEEAATIGVRQPFALAMSEHAAFENDVLAFRATSRYDINVHSGGDATTPGAFVGLKTAA